MSAKRTLLARAPSAALLAASLLASVPARAGSIEFQYFYPDRWDGDYGDMGYLWGPGWRWPLKQMPHRSTGNDLQSKLDTTYGLVYWPGETLELHLLDGAEAADRIECVDVVSGASLPVERDEHGAWRIVTHHPRQLRGTPFGTSAAFRPGRGIGAAFDDDPWTSFDAEANSGAYVGLDLGEPRAVGSIRFTRRPSCGYDDDPVDPRFCWAWMQGGRFQGTNGDPETGPYLDLAVIEEEPSLHKGTILETTDRTPYRYVRYLGPDGSHSIIAELHLHGPEPADPEPFLEVYRVTAYAGDEELASRGFILTLPWSGVRHQDDPYFPQNEVAFAEWNNGGNPFVQMTFQPHADSGAAEHAWSYAERPWGDLDSNGLSDLYFYRQNYESRPTNWFEPGLTLPSTDSYADPSFEMNWWWNYQGRGLGLWDGEFHWGPFSPASAGRIDAEFDTCYGQVRKYMGALPNGLLFWQWAYFGMNRMAAQISANATASKGVDFWVYDGWHEGLYGPLEARDRGEEVGTQWLYSRWLEERGAEANVWTDYPSFRDFTDEQAFDFWDAGGWNSRNPYIVDFFWNGLARASYATWPLAAARAYTEVTGTEPGYHGTELMMLGTVDHPVFNAMPRDLRPVREPWVELFQSRARTGDDYSHTMMYEQGSEFYSGARAYRNNGYHGATQCAIFPASYYGGGHRHAATGGVMPGSDSFDRAYDGPGEAYALYHRYEDDGTSFRRLDQFERVPSFYRPGGRMVGFEYAFLFGNSAYEPSREARWNTQGILGAQVMEIPDRRRPIGGILVFDSNNAEDRATSSEFATDLIWVDYLAAIHDTLGITTYANPDTESDVPSDIPRVYAPRRKGNGWVLTARVDGVAIEVPFAGLSEGYKRWDTLQVYGREDFTRFVDEVRAAKTGGWPIRTEGGFVATAWESTRGVFVQVENPMAAPGQIHSSRQGSITVRVRGLEAVPPVIDLVGEEPDPQRVPASALSRSGEKLTIALDWTRGDSRLYFIDAVLPYAPTCEGARCDAGTSTDDESPDGERHRGCGCRVSDSAAPHAALLALLALGVMLGRRRWRGDE